jgi:GTPase SAR1 family protein
MPVRRPGDPLRLLLALLGLLATAGLLYVGLAATERALNVWAQLEQLHPLLRYGLLAGGGALTAAGGWVAWRLLRGNAARAPRAEPIDRARIEARLQRLDEAGISTAPLQGELLELDRRRELGVLQLALFGDISAGKSSLLRALVPEAQVAIDVRGGSTVDVRHFTANLNGLQLQIADVPGTHGVEDGQLSAQAQAEAARAHALIYVADADLTRSQDADLRELGRFGRPLLLALNKSDRYGSGERAELIEHLQRRYAPLGAQVLAVAAGHTEQMRRVRADGSEDVVERMAPPELGALPTALAQIARIGAHALEPARESATLASVDQRLAAHEHAARAQQTDAILRKYTRRALVAALATIAPGTDLIIQGGLATAMLHELAKLHGQSLRELDIDRFLAEAGKRVRSHAAVLLAIAGNALKAFPGLGTLGGGLVHALAYGLLFDALGRAAIAALTTGDALDRAATLDAFEQQLAKPRLDQLQRLAALAVEAMRGEEKP